MPIQPIHCTYRRQHVMMILLALLILSVSTCSGVSALEQPKSVLFISAYTESFVIVPEQIEGIQAAFEPYPIQIEIEYMDTRRIETEENIEIFRQMLTYKLNQLPPYDAVLVGDDNALQFALDHQEELFSGIPIVFLGINDLQRAAQAANNPMITGVVEVFSLVETIEMAHQFHPEATRVVAIVDNTLTGQGDRDQFYQAASALPILIFEDLNASEYTYEALGEMLETMGEDTILLYMSMFQDSSGATMTIDEAVAFLKAHTQIPTYRASVGGVGEGLMGGKMVSYFEQGRVAADMVVQILQGTPISAIPMVSESPNQYFLDDELLREHGIDRSLIPKGSILLNQPTSFYTENRGLVNNALAVLAFLIILLMVTVFDNVRRRRIERELHEKNEELAAYNEEMLATEEELTAQYQTIQEHMEELAVLNQKYEIAISGTNSCVWEIDLETDRMFLSDDLKHILSVEINPSGNVESILNQLFPRREINRIRHAFTRYQSGTADEISLQISLKETGKSTRWVLFQGRGVYLQNGELVKLAGILLDITHIKEQEAHIDFLAHHDPLTRLPNRISFMNRIQEEIAAGHSGTVMLLDLDNFKAINDTLGHAVGDDVLREIALRLQRLTDDNFFVSRFGGDEFLILLSREADPKVIETRVRQILDVFESPFQVFNSRRQIHFSMGITRFPDDSSDMEQLIMNADTAMFQVKHSGKNHYMYFQQEMIEVLKEKVETERRLTEALAEDGFRLVYQPQVEPITGSIVGFEALLRLKGIAILPDRFIPVAEETGQIIPIGRWVVGEAIRQMASWRDQGLPLKPVAINLSSKQLSDEGLHGYLQQKLLEKNIPAEYLEVEITESVLLEESTDTTTFLNRLREIGIRIALDDFGTGYSSLIYLTYLPIQKIKLDKTLSDRFLKDESVEVMNSIITLGHSLNMEITAEGVEEPEQYRKLKKSGCDFMQGYLFSRPLPAEEVTPIYNSQLISDNASPAGASQ
ncbi:ABC transporter substrate binding protein [Anoxynatronum sibiricum]|uniref:ABC transporter substrate binding protein n=1 Tax=Anoxynatronum sibiricum TaxID=210623 RepID=A0ABU9VWD2_9CLOT